MNQLKSSFIANMSHEIRTPLTGIIGFADILEEQVEDDETRRHVEYIRKNGRRLLETLDSVLDLARLDADQIDLDPTPVPLADFVDETVALFRQWATDEELELRVSVVEEVGTVRIDQSALQRVLTNLVGNALKFTDEGHVALRVALVDGEKTPGGGTHLRFEVEDTGVGMEDAFLRKLFEEFTQERAGLRRSHEGAGLGLAISRRLVHLMDGRIDVESEPGVGTTFTVWVPYDPVVDGEEAEAGGQPESWGDEGTLHGWRVLVVDDRPEVGLIVEEFLDDFEVVAAQSAKGARRRAAEEDVDLLLLDIQLGDGTDGISLLPTLRETVTSPDRGETVPAIAITAHSLPGDRQRFLDEGFDGYLSKPFTRSDLRKTVERVLRVAHT
jgi:CheY-like chemotaxis protein/two-component sensor histidine kinase